MIFLPHLALLSAFLVRVDGIINSQVLVLILHHNSWFIGAESWRECECISQELYGKLMGMQVLRVQILTVNFWVVLEMCVCVCVHEWRHVEGAGEKRRDL